jgi:hypothetical protein
MQTLWSILALAFLASDGSPADKPSPLGPRFTVTVKVSEPRCSACPEASVETPEADACCERVEERAKSHELWKLSLPQAIRIALENSDFVRVTSSGLQTDGAPIMIARLTADDGDDCFKSDAMALVRSVEQQYWKLYIAQAHLANAERAAEIAEEVICDEAQALGCFEGYIFALAEAALRLEWINADVARGALSVVDNEQGLRTLMGLPPGDNRRIVPGTEPVAQWIVLGAKSAVRKATRAQRKRESDTDAPSAVDETTDSLPQLVREIHANFKSYKKARKTASADEKRLAVQMCAYEKGRISAGRLLDFVRQSAASSAAEAGCLATYNITLAAVCEKSGTLLTYRDISVAEWPAWPETFQAATAKQDDAARKTSFETDARAIEKDLSDGCDSTIIEAIPESESKPASKPAKPDSSESNEKSVVFSITLGGYTWRLSGGKDSKPAPEAN